MKKLFLAVLPALFLSVNFVNAQTVANFTEDFNTCLYNCNADEDVCLSGTIHIVQRNGGYHFNVRATGTGAVSGANYSLNYFENNRSEDNLGNYSALVILNGQGAVSNVRIKLIAHFTLNANGELVVDFFNITDNCD